MPGNQSEQQSVVQPISGHLHYLIVTRPGHINSRPRTVRPRRIPVRLPTLALRLSEMKVSRREIAYFLKLCRVQDRDAAFVARYHPAMSQVTHHSIDGYSSQANRITQLQLGEREHVTRARR